MEHSPDGKAYLVGMGAEENDPKPRYANLSWITADQIYLARVNPSVEAINDVAKYEFFAGNDAAGTCLCMLRPEAWSRRSGPSCGDSAAYGSGGPEPPSPRACARTSMRDRRKPATGWKPCP